MAAGRYGGYRHHELRERDFDLKAARRKDYHLDRDDRERSRGADLRDRIRDRRRDATEREPLNGYHRSPGSASNSSGRSGSGSGSGSGSDQKRTRLSGRMVEREPGELSSGSDESPVSQARDSGVQTLENGTLPSPSKKRKFSPIMWGRDDEKKSTDVSVALPPPPPLPHGCILPRAMEIARPSTEQPSARDLNDTLDAPQDQLWSEDREPGEMEVDDEENAPARNISTSRWADGDDALDADVVAVAKSKENLKPEFGVVISSEGSGRALSKPSDSDGEQGDEVKDLDVDGNDYMDVDRKEDDEDASDHLSDTDSESGDSRDQTPEPPESPELEPPPQRSINMLQGCRSVDEFERLNKINEGTYGVVYRAKDKKTGEIVALKKVKMEKEREGFPLTSLREINILLSLQHCSIVGVKEVVIGSSLDSIFMVMEYMDHDLKALMEAMKQPFSQSEVKCLMLQLLEGVDYLHDNWVLHRDLKTSNILLNNQGELKICDFGLSRQYGSPMKPYTHLVVTLWYRAPELLLGAKEYSTAIDMWSLGCIMAELLAKGPLFNGKTEFDQLDKIFRILGTPNEKIWPGFTKLPGVKVNFVRQPYNKLREKFPPITSFSGRPTLSEAGFDLLNKLLTYDPDKRITAKDALNHAWFREVPLPKSKEFMPTFPAQNAKDRCQRRIMKSPDPLEEQRRKELHQGGLGTGGLFG